MTLKLEDKLLIDDLQVKEMTNLGNGDLVRGLHQRLEQDHGPGQLETNYDGFRTLAYKFVPGNPGTPHATSVNKQEPPLNQVDATVLQDPDSMAAKLYGVAGIDEQLPAAIKLAKDNLIDTTRLKRNVHGVEPLETGDDVAIRNCDAINRLEKFLGVFDNHETAHAG